MELHRAWAGRPVPFPSVLGRERLRGEQGAPLDPVTAAAALFSVLSSRNSGVTGCAAPVAFRRPVADAPRQPFPVTLARLRDAVVRNWAPLRSPAGAAGCVGDHNLLS